jgi:glutamyl/glutaminyl-tRNA synthetase
VSLNHYRRAGFFPEALVNYPALMGGVMANDQEEFTLAEFVAGFSLERINLGGPVFDPQKLTWLNGKYLRKMAPPELRGRLHEYLLSDEYMLRVLPLVQERIDTLEGFFEYGHFFFAGEVTYDADAMKQLVPKGRTAAETAKGLQILLEERIDPLLEWEAAAIEAALRAFAQAAGWEAKDVFMTVRVAATGRAATPPLFDTLAVLGKEVVRRRCAAIEVLKGGWPTPPENAHDGRRHPSTSSARSSPKTSAAGSTHARDPLPPEPNGYSTSATPSRSASTGVAQVRGRTHLRFDDTNPTKEEQEYIDSIKETALAGLRLGESTSTTRPTTSISSTSGRSCSCRRGSPTWTTSPRTRSASTAAP